MKAEGPIWNKYRGSICPGASPMQRTEASPVTVVGSTQTLPEYSSNDIKRNLSDSEIRRK
jgi:hypothetical protein